MDDKSKIVLYTQRVEIIESYGERRDCADQQIAKFLWACGFTPVPANNLPDRAGPFLDAVRPSGILLTGGNDLVKYGGGAPERDETERFLLEYAMDRGIPLLGFCRGMQLIADYFGNPLQRVTGHTARRHPVAGELARESVNSYHNWGLRSVEEPLRVLSRAEDGVIESIRHRERSVMGIMWHPERETPFQDADIALASNFLNGKDQRV